MTQCDNPHFSWDLGNAADPGIKAMLLESPLIEFLYRTEVVFGPAILPGIFFYTMFDQLVIIPAE